MKSFGRYNNPMIDSTPYVLITILKYMISIDISNIYSILELTNILYIHRYIHKIQKIYYYIHKISINISYIFVKFKYWNIHQNPYSSTSYNWKSTSIISSMFYHKNVNQIEDLPPTINVGNFGSRSQNSFKSFFSPYFTL